MKKRTKIIIAVVIALLVVIAVGTYFYLTSKGFSFSTFDFSGGTGLYDNLGNTGNVFDNTKLNPFTNST